jgi:hypothetical protein
MSVHTFFPIMAEDFAYQQSITREAITADHPWLLAQVATDISSYLSQQNQSPSFDSSLCSQSPSNEDQVDLLYDHHMLNHDQQLIFDELIAAVEKRSNQIPFYIIDGPGGGSGKTYLNNTLLTHVRSHTHKALAVASTGIASTLLLDGNTAHSQFEIPRDLSEHSTCNMQHK